MLEKISMKMTKMCAKNMDLTETEWWTMFFGFENIIHQILLFGVIGVTAFCLHIFWWTVLFTLTFSCLRISAGGCHLKTSLGCIKRGFIVGCGKYSVCARFDYCF